MSGLVDSGVVDISSAGIIPVPGCLTSFAACGSISNTRPWVSLFSSESAVCLPAAYSKTCVKQPLSKRLETVFQDHLLLNGEVNAGQKYCRMLQGEHSAILSTFIQLPFASKIFFFYLF